MSQTDISRETIREAIERIRAKGAASCMVVPPPSPVLVLRRVDRQAGKRIGGIRSL